MKVQVLHVVSQLLEIWSMLVIKWISDPFYSERNDIKMHGINPSLTVATLKHLLPLFSKIRAGVGGLVVVFVCAVCHVFPNDFHQLWVWETVLLSDSVAHWHHSYDRSVPHHPLHCLTWCLVTHGVRAGTLLCSHLLLSREYDAQWKIWALCLRLSRIGTRFYRT